MQVLAGSCRPHRLPRCPVRPPSMTTGRYCRSPNRLPRCCRAAGWPVGRSSACVGQGATSLLFTLLAGPEAPWSALVGMPGVGLLAAAEFGVDLDRVVVIPEPGPDVLQVLSILIDGVDMIAVALPARGSSRSVAAAGTHRPAPAARCGAVGDGSVAGCRSGDDRPVRSAGPAWDRGMGGCGIANSSSRSAAGERRQVAGTQRRCCCGPIAPPSKSRDRNLLFRSSPNREPSNRLRT